MRRSTASLVVSSLVLAACTGSAIAATHTWQTSDFHRIRVEGPFDVRVRVGQPSGVRATGPQAAIDRVAVDQSGDTLVIHPVRTSGWNGWGWSDKNPLVIEVGARTLDAAALAGSGNLAIDRMNGDAIDLAVSGSGDLTVAAIDAARAKLTVTGSGDLTAGGQARTASAAVTGSGDLHAARLVARDASVNLAGSGDLALGATGAVAVALAGSGDVAITGPARCTVSRTGSGDVRCDHQTGGGNHDD